MSFFAGILGFFLNQSQLAFVALETEKFEAEQAMKRQELTRYGGGINTTTNNDEYPGKARDQAANKVGYS